MKLILTTLLASIAALSVTACTNTRAGRGYQVYGVNSTSTMASAAGGWSVKESRGGGTNLSYSDPAGYQPQ